MKNDKMKMIFPFLVARIKHIDGLRAAAIFPVVLYHAFPLTFPNGYLGVDYFLVISGFVISKKYFIQPTNHFSLRDFWSRRISRLYPQLLACVAICLPFAWAMMHPDHLENFSQSAIASLLGANNVLLYITGGYWNLANELKPLFTTWSLGLEEQFYLLIAIAFALSHKYLKAESLRNMFHVLFISSLIASAFGSLYFRIANYLLLPTRFWEFGIGIYAAYFSLKGLNPISSWITNLSFFMITVLSLAMPLKTAIYAPNPLLLIPLVGIAIICVSANNSIATRILSSKGFVYVGLSSYAIYLYHQPLLAFARLRTFNDLKTSTLIVLVVGSFLVGFMMYELIEKNRLFRPLGMHSLEMLRPKNLLIASTIIGLINVPIVINNGFFELRFPYMLVNGKPPDGFLGGKGYTDLPYIYQSRKFPDKSQEAEENSKLRVLNIFLNGDSKTRDLINTLETIDSKIPSLKFNYSYSNNVKADESILANADLIIVQIDNNGNKETHISETLLREFSDYSEKFLWHKSREQFVKNITPILFISDPIKRSNFKYLSTDSYSCDKESTVSSAFTPKNSALGIIDTQCAFNSQTGHKILTSDSGEIYSFDGIHLTLAGAQELGNNLIESKLFREILGL